MPLDGIVVNALVYELNSLLMNGRIDKVYQPEKEQLIIYIRNHSQNYKLLLSATSNSPRIHLTTETLDNPATPPMFCMLLRKHIIGGRIVALSQPDFERIVQIHIESYNELGDLTIKKLIIEIMGRHSNIIFINDEGTIIDSIKHIDASISSVRQVLPGLVYSFPPSQNKQNPLTVGEQNILSTLSDEREGAKVSTAIVNNFTGISPLIGREICFRTLLDIDMFIGQLTNEQKHALSSKMYRLFQNIGNSNFTPILLIEPNSKNVIDFAAVSIAQYDNLNIEDKTSINETLDIFYAARDHQSRLKQKSSSILKLIATNLERCYKKLAIHQQKLQEVGDREQLMIFGNLITANIYRIEEGMESIEVENFYADEVESNATITITLDPHLSPSKNARKYFDQYSKAKSAEKYLIEQIEHNTQEIKYLESVHEAILSAETAQEIDEIKIELSEQGYAKRINKVNKNKNSLSKPKHFISSEGFDIYVGKNNKQNDYLTLKFAHSQDIWLHTKTIPGSHVIIKKGTHDSIPQNTILEAALLAAYYSKGRASSNVAIDYTTVKNVKKPSGAKPGMVIYENYKTIYVTPDEALVNKLGEN